MLVSHIIIAPSLRFTLVPLPYAVDKIIVNPVSDIKMHSRAINRGSLKYYRGSIFYKALTGWRES